MIPLSNVAAKEAQSQSQSQSQPRRQQLQAIVFTTITIVAIFVFLSVVSESESFSGGLKVRTVDGNSNSKKASGGKISKKGGNDNNQKANNAVCSTLCDKRRKKRVEILQGANLLDRKELLQRASAAKERLLEKLRTDYGEYFEPIFVDKVNGGYRPFDPITKDGPSFERLKRKLMIKVLSMQLTLYQQDSNFNGCDCSNGKDEALRNDVEDPTTEDPAALAKGIDTGSMTFEKYVWATGGHSAAAGHGNLYNETYTAYMESDLKDVFGSIGIEFEGRNYAMGGTSSATDVSMCWKEIFGEDVDFFSWDYGMTDGNDATKMFHYCYRGGLSAGRPAAILIHAGGRNLRSRIGAYKNLEEMGMATFYGNEDSMKVMRDEFPDSSGLTTEAIDELPEYVRNYKCDNAIEKGDPFCGTEKFTKWGCPKRLKQTSWHPGFKDHAAAGHGLALFLMDALLSTLQDLSEHQIEDTRLLLSQLQQEDEDLHTNFTKAELPAFHKNLLKVDELAESEPKIDASLFYKGRSMCHTGKLPSQIRYQGILTDTDKVGQQAPVGEEKYYTGFDMSKAKETVAENGTMRLVYEMNKERENCPGYIVKPDYPDFFYTNELDGWTKLTFPNEAEKKAYGYDPTQYEGMIILHTQTCSWGKCPKGFLTLVEDHAEKHWEMKINDQLVSTVIGIGNGASVVKGENGIIFTPNSNGQYEIEIRVNKDKNFLEVSSFVLY